MAIDIDTARKVAKLARIRVEEGDLPKLAGQLSGILGFMEQLNEVDVTGVEPMVSVTPMRLKRRADVVTDGEHSGAGAEERARRTRGVLCGAEGGGMSANTWTIAAARDALRKGEISAVDLTMSCLTAMDAGDDLNAFVWKTPRSRWSRHGRRMRG
jgi:aspartyl-tRNA(Asn)/glutamyl-tRNA(Gln) amidotransferase subunit C